ncbi:MAG: sterol desaturase family protein [Chitinophagales bacterium]
MAKKLFVSTKDESPKMFENRFLDFFSRVPYWVPLLIFLPVIGYYAYRAFAISDNSILAFSLSVLVGIFIWTIAEYLIHRYIFHGHPKAEWAKKIHYTFHGIHHDFPQDSLRLVMPPPVSIPLAVIFFWGFYGLMLPLGIIEFHSAFFVGFVGAYLFYDMMHYFSHHGTSKNKYFAMIKEHHMKHHYKEPDAGFGFTSKIWDRVFKTDFPEEE